MSIRNFMLGTVSTLAVAGGLVTAGAVTANAATPGCGPHCVEIFSAKFGTYANPGFVESAFGGVAETGVPTGLSPISATDPAGDMIVSAVGPVSDFYAIGMVSEAVNEHYGNLTAVQIQYAPQGDRSADLCAGLATTAYQDQPLSLQPCSTPGTTVFIIGTPDTPPNSPYFPIINASTTDFDRPFAMTISDNPAREDFVPITVHRLKGSPGNVPANQLWGSNVLN